MTYELVGQVFCWSLSHGKSGKFCVLLVIDDDSPKGPTRCLVIDGNHALGYGDVFPGQSIFYGWYYLNQMKRLV